MLAITFVAALGAAGFVATDSADAHGRGRGYRGGHGGGYYNSFYAPSYGYYPHVHRASYWPAPYYGAPVYYGRSYYGGGHGCHDRGGVSFSIGF
jgi:hypothetical protein